jgi:hypothetical protein
MMVADLAGPVSGRLFNPFVVHVRVSKGKAMQASQTCMFCRYRKARIAACCAGQRAPSTNADAGSPAHSAPPPSPLSGSPDRTVTQLLPQEAPAFA